MITIYATNDTELEMPADQLSRLTHWLKNNKGDVIIQVKKRGKPKSDKQRGYYWDCILRIIEEETGQPREDAHVYCKAQFLIDRSGRMPRIRSTEELTTVECEDYYKKIREHFSTEFRIMIPLPNEAIYEDQ